MSKKLEDNRCKGANKSVVAESLTLDDYKTWLFIGKIIYRGQILFENKKHGLYAVYKHKIALHSNDDKRHVQADGITSLAR